MSPRIRILLLSIAAASFLRAADPVATVSDDDVRFGKVKIIGCLGVPIGDYVTIEGIPCLQTMGDKTYPTFEDIEKHGVQSLEVYFVNGMPLKAPVTIWLSGDVKYPPAKRYTIRGVQTASLTPRDLQDPQEPPQNLDLPQVYDPFTVRFLVTKILKAETE